MPLVPQVPRVGGCARRHHDPLVGSVVVNQLIPPAGAIAYRRQAYPDGAPTPGYFRFHTVGVENDSIADFYLSSLAGGQLIPNMRRFTTPSAAMAANCACEAEWNAFA